LLDPLDDSARLAVGGGQLCMTTDGFVVSPLFFHGGDIGSLAINGTVNDLAVSGAVPRFLSLGAILEEGLPLETLERLVESLARAAREADVAVVTGDTKVVERGKGDGAYLTTTGVGVQRDGFPLATDPEPGAVIIVSGPVGDHGAVILAARNGLDVSGGLKSDCAPVTPLVDALFDASVVPRFMRDPTRGGLAGVLADLAEHWDLGVSVLEERLPVRETVATVCDIVGIDPLHLACEGRVVAVVRAEDRNAALEAWRGARGGAQATSIGELTAENRGKVVMTTRIGGQRLLARPTAELLPRIC
jgi:hydrogenase expression/formation protein HypE